MITKITIIVIIILCDLSMEPSEGSDISSGGRVEKRHCCLLLNIVPGDGDSDGDDYDDDFSHDADHDCVFSYNFEKSQNTAEF